MVQIEVLGTFPYLVRSAAVDSRLEVAPVAVAEEMRSFLQQVLTVQSIHDLYTIKKSELTVFMLTTPLLPVFLQNLHWHKSRFP